MKDILRNILEDKGVEMYMAQIACPLNEIKAMAADMPPTRSLRRSLETHRGGIIAEFKRRSPSKGWINAEADVADIIPAYEAAGAGGLSILTDRHYFGGYLDDIMEARTLTQLPILRKDFVIESYQLYQARVAGADACLLIAAALGAERCHELAAEAHEIGLEVLLEVHSEEELEACSPHVDLLGVNNRDLRTFHTDPAQSERLFAHLPQGPLPISESGLLDPQVAARLRRAGYRGFLVGEAFMRTDNPGQALADYLREMGD